VSYGFRPRNRISVTRASKTSYPRVLKNLQKKVSVSVLENGQEKHNLLLWPLYKQLAILPKLENETHRMTRHQLAERWEDDKQILESALHMVDWIARLHCQYF